jgi:hypothetical protein
MPDKHHKKSGSPKPEAFGRGQMPKRLTWGVLITLGVLVLAFLILKSGKPPAEPVKEQSAATNAPAPRAASSAVYEKLKGRWLRPDGEYVLQINAVDAEGKLEAAYYNPNKINVARANAFKDGPDLKVFVELRDANYPGCTYTMVYDPQRDRLSGIYYQAAIQQQFDIEFERMKD